MIVSEPSSEKLLLTWLLLPGSVGLEREHCLSVLSPCLIPLARGHASGQFPESECGDKEKQNFGRQRYTVTLGTSKEGNVIAVMLACDTQGQPQPPSQNFSQHLEMSEYSLKKKEKKRK